MLDLVSLVNHPPSSDKHVARDKQNVFCSQKGLLTELTDHEYFDHVIFFFFFFFFFFSFKIYTPPKPLPYQANVRGS